MDEHGRTTLSDLLRPSPAPEDNLRCRDPHNPQQPCPVCGGLGVIKYAVPPDDPRFGKFFRCPNNPVAVDEERQERLRKLSNLGAFADKTFSSFTAEVPGYNSKQVVSLQMAYNTALRYAQSLEGWLLLEGTYGTGKTHLAAAVGNARLQQGDLVLFITTPDLLDHLRSTYAPGAEVGFDATFERLRNAQLLILDDLGVENPSEWAKEKLFQLLNHRYSHQLPTVVTTNADLDALDARVRSRLLDRNVTHRVVIDAPDYRSATGNERDQLASRLTMYAHMTFEHFDVETRVTSDEHQRLTQAARTAYQYAQRPENWLLFAGDFGTGKTHLAAAIANYRRDQGDEVMFMTVPDLLDYLRTTFSDDAKMSFDALFHRVRNVGLLVLDDIGAESSKPWAQEKLFQILEYRYVGQLPTVMTTARTLGELNPRVVSRLIDGRICRIVEIAVKSYAERMKR